MCIGKTNMPFVADGLDLYTKRIGRYVKFEWEELPDVKNSKRLSPELLKQEEGKLILKRIQPNERMILLDEGGKMFGSVAFADWVQRSMSTDGRDLCFVIGGAYGFSEDVYANAELKISISKMTFSHQIIRTIFAEQLYRAFTIIRGEPYHHA